MIIRFSVFQRLIVRSLPSQHDGECPKQARDRMDAGYSLLEILVVLAIMGVLIALVAPRFLGQLERSQVTAAQTQAQGLKSALDVLFLDIGRYPAADEGLGLLVEPPSDPRLRTRWFGPYLEGGLPLVPWGNEYVYVPPAVNEAGMRLSAVVMSFGADGAEGGEGLDADIYSRRTDAQSAS